MRADTYQVLLIASGILVTGLLGAFFYREIYPEYKIYQKDYLALEEFHSEETKESVPPFQIGIKQIVMEREDLGPPAIDRCTSCHVALQIPYFSPTKLARDMTENIVRNKDGIPVQEPNEEYIWAKLDKKIAELRDEKVNEHLKQQGDSDGVKIRLREAERYESLKTAQVGGHTYDLSKVLAMHPLIGKETRPFEFHPIEEYGCTSCHNGNGRGLTTERAHGPVFDGQYEAEARGFVPQFTEPDPENDPPFARMFNAKPGHALLFQTTPLYVGSLIQSKCMQCHLRSDVQLELAANSAFNIAEKRQRDFKLLEESLQKDKQTLASLLEIKRRIQNEGVAKTLEDLKQEQSSLTLSSEELERVIAQVNYLNKITQNQKNQEMAKGQALDAINQRLSAWLGSQELIASLQEGYNQSGKQAIDRFIKENEQNPLASGSLLIKSAAIRFDRNLLHHIQDTQDSFQATVQDQRVVSALKTDIDSLSNDYQKGKQLYLSQACYACHRIAGLARGGVGPELTRIGQQYPWYIKESIVWPQADLVNSTMPNMRLDHEELEDLMTFLLAQNGANKAVAQSSYLAAIQSWEAGRKQSWEKPASPAQMFDVRYGMHVFATEGCASCHRLLGFESNVGFKVEKDTHLFADLYEQQQWFRKIFPEVVRISQYDEELPGSMLVAQMEKYAQEIDARIASDVRQNSILEEINQTHPAAIEALYSNFRYASRAKDHYYETLVEEEKDPDRRAQIEKEHLAWKDRVHRVLMTYVQIYGLGRLIGPRPNWSGIFRSDEWLMEHFRNPSAHVPRSIMPAMPFDDTKFYALTYMLNQLATRNRDVVRQIWQNRGFDPQMAYELHCAQCHGVSLTGNGAVAEWIYPIPKSLRDPVFLRHLTKEMALYSIVHGVKGSPMPPWGEMAKDKPEGIQKRVNEAPVLTEAEAQGLVDWIFASLPGGEVIRESKDVLKWEYKPEDVLDELKQEERAQARFDVDEVFNVISGKQSGNPELDSYYIKKKYYTPYNLQMGQKFFLLNCAICHGNEGDGTGSRSRAMQEAKPRVLTNLDWIRSRDDLRLLRSIKYGVPGTSMTPWGDQTNALQRMQLVLFIRSLTEEIDRRQQLLEAAYEAFDPPQFLIDRVRLDQSQRLVQLQRQEQELKDHQTTLERQITQGQASPEGVIKLYEQSLKLAQQVKAVKQQDEQLAQLKEALKKQKELYINLGVGLMTKNISDEAWQTYLSLLQLNQERYRLQNGQLKIAEGAEVASRIRFLQKGLIAAIDQKLEEEQQQKKTLQGRIASAQIQEELEAVESEMISYRTLRTKVSTDIEEALRLMNLFQKSQKENQE